MLAHTSELMWFRRGLVYPQGLGPHGVRSTWGPRLVSQKLTKYNGFGLLCCNAQMIIIVIVYPTKCACILTPPLLCLILGFGVGTRGSGE